MMRPLIIDDEAKAKVAQVLRFAESHPYEPADQDEPPGDNPHSVCQLNAFRCVFSFTKVEGRTFRDVSISLPGDRWPHPFAAFTIAELFGFTGWDGQTIKPPGDWMIGRDRVLVAVRIAQELK